MPTKTARPGILAIGEPTSKTYPVTIVHGGGEPQVEDFVRTTSPMSILYKEFKWWAAGGERTQFIEAMNALDSSMADEVLTHLATKNGAYKSGKNKGMPKFAFDLEMKEALNIGNEAHEWIKADLWNLLGSPAKIPEQITEAASRAVSGWHEWKKAHDFFPLAAEFRVANLFAGYAGAVDCVGVVDGTLTVLDWKSSKAIWPEMFLQVEAYRWAINGMSGRELPKPLAEYMKKMGPIQKSAIVRLNKLEGDDAPAFEYVEVDTDAGHYDAYLSLLKVYKWHRTVGGR